MIFETFHCKKIHNEGTSWKEVIPSSLMNYLLSKIIFQLEQWPAMRLNLKRCWESVSQPVHRGTYKIPPIKKRRKQLTESSNPNPSLMGDVVNVFPST